MFIAIIPRQSAGHVSDGVARKNGNPIIAFLAQGNGVIACGLYGVHGEIGRLAFDFLQTDDIRCRRFQPTEKQGQTGLDRIDVPARDTQ